MIQRQTALKQRSIMRHLSPAKKLLKNVPILGSLVAKSVNSFRWVILRSRIKFRSRKLGLPVDKIHFIDPKNIEYCTLREFGPATHIGRLIDGDWDQSNVRFNQLDVFVAMKQRYFEGVTWVQTDFYQNTLERLNQGDVLWGCTNESDLEQRFQQIDQLFQDIQKNGYKSQLELNNGKLRNSFEDIDEVSVNLDRDGRVLFNNSAHRLAIAQLLDIAEIPVVVTVRRSEAAKLFI